MAVTHAQIEVGTMATELTAVDTSNTFGEVGQSLLVQNEDNNVAVYIGDVDVTSSVYGFKLSAATSQIFPITLAPGEQIYGIVASGTATVNVIHQGV